MSPDEVKSFNAQMEAHKQMLNEQLQSNLHLRTQVVLLQLQVQDLQKQIADLNAKAIPVSAPAKATKAN